VFYIGFVTGPRVDEDGWPHAEGEIVLGGFREGFQADLRFWDMPAYETQWRQAILRLVGGVPATALVTSYRGPGGAYHFTWPMWREGSTVHVQERIMFADQLGSAFDPQSPDEHVGDHAPVNAEGEALSEWHVPLGELATFTLAE
jgi:hypothetical protein